MQVTAAGYSHTGPRSTNQDCFFADASLGLFVVADGMGGHNAGEVASRMAVDAVVDFVRVSRDSREMTWPFPFDPQLSHGANRLLAAIRVANQRVHDAGGGQDPARAGMGTTLVVLMIEGRRMIVGHAGDSRAYRIRHTGLEQMTVDDTWINAMLGAGADLHDHPMRHVLTSGIGMRPDLVPTVMEEDIEPPEQWLITSDGVHGYVTPLGLAQGLIGGSAPDDAARRIVNSALQGSTADNATAVVVRIDP